MPEAEITYREWRRRRAARYAEVRREVETHYKGLMRMETRMRITKEFACLPIDWFAKKQFEAERKDDLIATSVAAMLVQMAISRTREYSADRIGGEICGHPLWLASALQKLDTAAKRIDNAQAERNPATTLYSRHSS